MYVAPGTFENVGAYLTGLDEATGCLTGFREWLLPRLESGDNLTWLGVVLCVFEKEACEIDRRIERLGELIEEFFEFVENRSTHEGLMRVYVRYHAWLLTQDYYQPGFPGYVAPYDGAKSLPLILRRHSASTDYPGVVDDAD